MIAVEDVAGCDVIAFDVAVEFVPNDVDVRASIDNCYRLVIETVTITNVHDGRVWWPMSVDSIPLPIEHAMMGLNLLNCPVNDFSIDPFYCLKTCAVAHRVICASSYAVSCYPKQI